MNARLVSSALLLIGIALVTAGFAMLFGTPSSTVFALPEAEVEPFTDLACLDCHTDEKRLQELAEPVVEEAESALSSGPG